MLEHIPATLPPPWERQPGEPDRWFDRFERIYLRMGAGRTLLGAYRKHLIETSEPGTVGRVSNVSQSWTNASRAWNWQARAAAWDEMKRRERQEREEAEARDMLERQRLAGRKLQELGLRRLIEIEANLGLINATEARKYVEEGARIERESRGLPGRVDQVNTGTVATPQVSLRDFDWAAAVGLDPSAPAASHVDLEVDATDDGEPEE